MKQQERYCLMRGCYGLYLLCLLPVTVIATERGISPVDSPENSARIYRSPEERREAGLGRQITDWLRISGLAEIETVFARNHLMQGKDMSDSERPALALQFGLEMTFTEWLEAELIYDFETDGERKFSDLDEAMIGLDLEPWNFNAGLQYAPFGEYYSHFVSGPMLEFGETRAASLIIDYSVNDHLELAGYILDGDSRRSGSEGFYADWDWGAGIELVSAGEAVRAGAGYLSDLSESDEALLADSGNTYDKRVPAWNAYALLGFERYEVTAEVVQATKAFRGLDQDADKPFAWNLELAWFARHTVQYAVRLEHSDELEDQPRWQYGVAATWRPHKNVSLSLEYLRGKYKKDFVQDDEDNSLNSRDRVAAQVSFEF